MIKSLVKGDITERLWRSTCRGRYACIAPLFTLLAVALFHPGKGAGIEKLPLKNWKEIQNPIALATRLFRQSASDALPQRGMGGAFALSPDGASLAFEYQYYNRLTQGDETRIRIQTGDATQREFQVAAWKGKRIRYGGPEWSGDGKRLFFHCQDITAGRRTHSVIWSCALDGTGVRRHTPPMLSAESPALAPDGRRLAFVKYPPNRGRGDLCLLDMVSGRIQSLIRGGVLGRARWSPDGRWIAFVRTDPRTGSDHLEIVAPASRQRRVIASLAAIQRNQPKMNLITDRFVWLPDSSRLLVTMDNRQPAAMQIWMAGRGEKPRLLELGEVLAETQNGRKALVKQGERYGLAELSKE
jgi:Tol biopolymer transport system component